MSVFNVGLFSGPKYSAFPLGHNNKISMKGGKIVPIFWDFLNTGDKIDKVDVSNVVRVQPMVAPTLDTYRIDVHAFAIRLRSIGHVSRNPWAYEDFFNLNKNQDGSKALPSLPLGLLFAVNGLRNGTLFESMGFPTFKDLREQYLSFLRDNYAWIFDPVEVYVKTNAFMQDWHMPTSQSGPYGNIWVPSTFPYITDDEGYASPDPSFSGSYVFSTSHGVSNSYKSTLSGVDYSYRGTLIQFIREKYGIFPVDPIVYKSTPYGVGFNGTAISVFDEVKDLHRRSENYLDEVYKQYKIDSVSVLREYEDWLLDGLLGLTQDGAVNTGTSFYDVYQYATNSVFAYLKTVIYNSFPDLPSKSMYSGESAQRFDRFIPAYPFEAYWKIISDWYINTAISEPDQYFLSQVIDDSFGAWQTPGWSYIRGQIRLMNEFANRFWNNDYFTSAFPSPQAGQAVGIPVNGTIVDLRNANAMQKLKERLLYAGSRFRDVLFAITGHKTSAAILEMSEVLASWSNTINVDSVLQQSETSVNSPQASYAGTGLGYRSGGKPFSYRADEPTVIMIVASIVPQTSYFQGLSRKFLRSNIYDYAIPQLANVGEQKIYRGELYLDRDSNPSSNPDNQVFGWTRRNGDWMWTSNEVHGDFRGSLDFWHNSRIFGSIPVLSNDFLQVKEEDDNLTRIFAVNSPSVDHFLCRFDFGGQVIRSLPKHVHYDL